MHILACSRIMGRGELGVLSSDVLPASKVFDPGVLPALSVDGLKDKYGQVQKLNERKNVYIDLEKYGTTSNNVCIRITQQNGHIKRLNLPLVVPAPFKPPGAPHGNPAIPFPNESSIWEVYINESVVVDNELAAIFSSVLSAFIIESKKLLEQDPADVMVDALIFFINNTANGTHTPYSRTSFSPASHAVSVNCLFFASLSASIIAALASVVSLQWVAEYDAATVLIRGNEKVEDERDYRGTTGVVIGGTLLGAVFYLITTMLAVIFPSSPYRAPIVRWIYLFFHLILRYFMHFWRHSMGKSSKNDLGALKASLKNKIRDTLAQARGGVSTLFSFLTHIPSRFESSTYRRDQSHIKLEQKQLVGNSLAWAARNLSISRDSHRRLLFLIQECVELDEAQWLSSDLQEVPWGLIIYFLASEYAECAASRKLTEDDEKELVIIFRCLRKMGVADSRDDMPPNFQALGGPDDSIDPIHLLFYDTEVPDGPQSIEGQIELRVGYLNQLHYLSQSIQDIRNMHKEITSKGITHIRDYLIPRLARALAGRAHDDDQDRVDNLIFLAHLGSLPPRGPSVVTSWSYGDIPVSRSSTLIQRLKCVNWIKNQDSIPHIHDILNTLLVVQLRNPDVSPLWRLVTTDEDVAATSILVGAQHRSELMDLINYERKAPRLNGILQAFDLLIARGCNNGQRRVLIQLLCNELQNPKLPPSSNHYVTFGLQTSFRDPWIQFVVYLAAGMDKQLDHLYMKYSRFPYELEPTLSRYVLSDGDWEVYLITKRFKPECISRLLEFADDVKRHPSRLICLLIKIIWPKNTYDERHFGTQHAMNLYYMVILVEDHCTGDEIRSHIASSHQLASALERERDAVAKWTQSVDLDFLGDISLLGDKDTFIARCTRVIHGLLTPSLKTFGIQASRTLACARPLLVPDAATNWLGMYDL
ncbi:11898_t:CDS:2 [Acaulospora colombiana]|uniref:11898_t:CDS:1 n=1 Tax=Acaulospora colombiana TaxID=27376 RepID=A0ACA9N0Q6_9GLOM|nr:11898_t:CDS:2 [Acaulospora colombiana]